MRLPISPGNGHGQTPSFGWMTILSLVISQLAGKVYGHIAPWHKGMYCLNGTNPGLDDEDTNAAVNPLFMLNKTDWWFHHVNQCDEFPPAPGDFLELPANGNFTVELTTNRGFTTLSYNGTRTGIYDSGLVAAQEGKAPDDCITNPNIHTQNETMAAGTAFAISYVSDLSEVTEDNLVVFTVLYHTPWERIATYQVPNLPACPEPEGCICAWGWVANGCGEPNMYMLPYRCRVTGQTGPSAVAKAVPPTWCESDATNCTSGAKQLVYWNQLEGNNVFVSGFDLSGQPKSPGYNMKMGFKNGAQTDIFLSPGSATTTVIAPAPTATTPPAKAAASKAKTCTFFLLLPIIFSSVSIFHL
ncbi:hypothetical protein CPC08DRAFT_754632 [Agrocybe pediades]|nr:hypothetical protein CPC08DRAFT_754632 [Agrocybe pediades]